MNRLRWAKSAFSAVFGKNSAFYWVFKVIHAFGTASQLEKNVAQPNWTPSQPGWTAFQLGKKLVLFEGNGLPCEGQAGQHRPEGVRSGGGNAPAQRRHDVAHMLWQITMTLARLSFG